MIPSKYLAIALAAFIAAFHAVGSATAQESIITDRPDFTESGISVPKGNVQIEGGFSLVDYGSVNFFNIPETLVRIGMSETVEIRVGVPDYEDHEYASGIGDLKIGGKLEIPDLFEGWETAAIATIELPTGDDDIGSDHLSIEAILAGGTQLNETYSLGTQVMAGLAGTDDGTDFEIGGTVVVARPIADALNGFLELAALIPEVGEMELILHSGLTYLIQNNLQLDLHVGIGLTQESPDSLFGAGVSVIL